MHRHLLANHGIRGAAACRIPFDKSLGTPSSAPTRTTTSITLSPEDFQTTLVQSLAIRDAKIDQMACRHACLVWPSFNFASPEGEPPAILSLPKVPPPARSNSIIQVSVDSSKPPACIQLQSPVWLLREAPSPESTVVPDVWATPTLSATFLPHYDTPCAHPEVPVIPIPSFRGPSSQWIRQRSS